jgi:hypothetical protein
MIRPSVLIHVVITPHQRLDPSLHETEGHMIDPQSHHPEGNRLQQRERLKTFLQVDSVFHQG